MNRMEFIASLSGLALTSAAAKTSAMENKKRQRDPVTDENFWNGVRKDFFLDENFIDLRANSASSIPRAALNKFEAEYRFAQALPSYRNSEMNDGAIKKLRAQIAGEINCSEREIAVMRNTTEALNNAIMGIPLTRGDEVVASAHEYDSMMGSFHQRRLREGISVKTIDIPYRVTSREEILALWEKSITPRTKVFLISQMVWISGQIYPVKEICALARKHNILTIIDAAHSFSHIKTDVRDLGCDYFGTSLHKWCAAPLGTGFLYVRRELVSKTFPLMAHYIHKPDADDIEKFENFGSVTPVFGAALASLEYWRKIGLELKEKRMHFLKNYWTERLAGNPKIEIATNTDEKFSCGVAFFSVVNRSAAEIAAILWKEHKIRVPHIENYKNDFVDYGAVNVVGVATPVFVTVKQLDKFVRAIEKIV